MYLSSNVNGFLHLYSKDANSECDSEVEEADIDDADLELQADVGRFILKNDRFGEAPSAVAEITFSPILSR